MTTPRDPLVVIAGFVKAVPAAIAHLEAERVQVIACESVGQAVEANLDDEGRAYVAQLDAILNPLRTALSASAPMPAPEHQPFPHVGDNDSWTAPAPERVGVEEVIRAMHSFEASCIVFGATTMGKNDRAIAECHSLMNDKRAALESAVRRLGGGA